jgi:hypothetical protein
MRGKDMQIDSSYATERLVSGAATVRVLQRREIPCDYDESHDRR